MTVKITHFGWKNVAFSIFDSCSFLFLFKSWLYRILFISLFLPSLIFRHFLDSFKFALSIRITCSLRCAWYDFISPIFPSLVLSKIFKFLNHSLLRLECCSQSFTSRCAKSFARATVNYFSIDIPPVHLIPTNFSR